MNISSRDHSTFTESLAGSGRDPIKHIQTVYVEESCLHLPYTQAILERAREIPHKTIPDGSLPECGDAPYPDNLRKGKQTLLLCRNHGKFLKPCPATREYRCCDYQVLNIGMNCPMDCVYCILQAYMNNPHLSFFVNTDDLLKEIDAALQNEPHRFLRIGTGEFTDSLALDGLTGLSKMLVEHMRDKSNAVLELKTKTSVINNLKNLNHKGRTIVSWSLNAPQIMNREERKTASLEKRLAAANRCADWGYKLAFHFDPIIFHPGWEQGYAETIDKLLDTVPKDRIVWISMGTLRFLPHLKHIALRRFPNSKFFHEEFVLGLDNKYRYFRTLRVEMYKKLYALMREKVADSTCLYFCMESDEIWQEIFGFVPEDHGGLPAMLDRAVEAVT